MRVRKRVRPSTGELGSLIGLSYDLTDMCVSRLPKKCRVICTARASSSIKPPGVGEPVFHQSPEIIRSSAHPLQVDPGDAVRVTASHGWSHGGSHGRSQRGYHLYCD